MARFGGTNTVPNADNSSLRIWCPYRCDNCGALSIAYTDHLTSAQPVDPATWIEMPGVTLQWLPANAFGKDFPDVPAHIAEAASEAYQCLSISALRAAVQLARSVVEATAKEKGITTGNLMTKIDELYNQHFVREYIKDAAHEVRHLGNDMAHGDFIDPVSSDEAELVLTLMSEILDEVYQSPARVARAQATRAAKKAAAATNP